MKKFTLLMLLFWGAIHYLKADQIFEFPKVIKPQEVTVRAINHGIITMVSNDNLEVWQFKIGSDDIVFHYTFNQENEANVYEAKFKDGGKSLRKTKHAFEVNNDKNLLCKIGRYAISENNEIAAIVRGYEAKPAIGKNPDGTTPDPDKDFFMEQFYILITLKNNRIEEYLPIDTYIEPGYYLDAEIDFYRQTNDFVFSITKERLSSDNNFFLGQWSRNNGGLKFMKFIPLEVPDFNKARNIGYGLMGFIYKQKRLIFYSCPYFYNLDSLTITNLEQNNIPNTDYSAKAKGDVFSINFSVCDFILQDNMIKLIVRKGASFSVLYYDAKTFSLKNEIPIPDIKSSDLYRFPFFTTEGEIVILQVNSGKIRYFKS